jgi:hypothetical protein
MGAIGRCMGKINVCVVTNDRSPWHSVSLSNTNYCDREVHHHDRYYPARRHQNFLACLPGSSDLRMASYDSFGQSTSLSSCSLTISVDCIACVSISVPTSTAYSTSRGMFTVLGLDFVYNTESSLSLSLIVVFTSLAGITTGLIQMLLHYPLKAGFRSDSEVSHEPDKLSSDIKYRRRQTTQIIWPLPAIILY